MMAGQKWEAELGPVPRVEGYWVGELGGTQLPTTNSLLGGTRKWFNGPCMQEAPVGPLALQSPGSPPEHQEG